MGMKEVYTHIWRCQAAVVLWIVADILAALPPEISATVSESLAELERKHYCVKYSFKVKSKIHK